MSRRLAIVFTLASALAAGAQDFGPGIYVDAQLWNTPGWQSREGDYAYARVTPNPGVKYEVPKALQEVPANRRMLLFSNVAGMEELLHQLVQVEGFKLGALGLDLSGPDGGDPIEACSKGEAIAHRYGLKFLLSISAIEEQRRLYQKILTAHPGVTLFQNVSPGSDKRLLHEYQGNADLVHGILVSGPAVLRAIRPQLGQPYAVARNEGPSMYFFNFLWNTPGWQPREGDYAFVKIRPALKTLDQKVNYCLAELKDIPPEYRKIMVNELAGASELLHELIEVKHFPVAALDYDLEAWELTPDEEKADPLGACKRGQALADKYKMAFVVVPDMPMSTKWAVRIAPFVAGLAPQSKGLQVENIDNAILRQRKLYSEIRRANPGIILYHDLGAAPKGVLQSAKGLLHYYSGVADLVDGIEIWSQNVAEQNAVIGKYIIAVRPPWQPGTR